jgi:creatinine amidohydrolase
VRYKTGEIAKQLGNALVAPVVAYVPEGEIKPTSGHMRFAGTITLPQDVFVRVLEMQIVDAVNQVQELHIGSRR